MKQSISFLVFSWSLVEDALASSSSCRSWIQPCRGSPSPTCNDALDGGVFNGLRFGWLHAWEEGLLDVPGAPEFRGAPWKQPFVQEASSRPAKGGSAVHEASTHSQIFGPKRTLRDMSTCKWRHVENPKGEKTSKWIHYGQYLFESLFASHLAPLNGISLNKIGCRGSLLDGVIFRSFSLLFL